MQKILVIDDDSDILQIVYLILNKEKFKVYTLSSGEEFLETVKQRQPDLIILDIQLGHFDGRELCKQLKSHKEYQHIKVVLFTANITYAQNIRDYCGDEFLEKPFEAKTIVNKVKSLLI